MKKLIAITLLLVLLVSALTACGEQKEICTKCDGDGIAVCISYAVAKNSGKSHTAKDCSDCYGTGYKICSKCDGEGYLYK